LHKSTLNYKVNKLNTEMQVFLEIEIIYFAIGFPSQLSILSKNEN